MGKYSDAVINGAELLDEVWPGWYKRVDEASLDLGDCTACILGQVYGGYTDGVNRLFDIDYTNFYEDNRRFRESAIGFGFEAPSASGNNYQERSGTEYAILNHHWKIQIEKRIMNDGVVWDE